MTSTISRRHEGARMSLSVSANGLVFLAGITAVETRGRSVAAQAEEIFKRIDGLLAEAHTDKSRLISGQVWLTEISTFDEFNRVWDRWVTDAGKPVRACVEARLADPELKVEVMIVAAAASS
jgi:enamine deaminase RidA (YjgF/YER057c/UK114 family)